MPAISWLKDEDHQQPTKIKLLGSNATAESYQLNARLPGMRFDGGFLWGEKGLASDGCITLTSDI